MPQKFEGSETKNKQTNTTKNKNKNKLKQKHKTNKTKETNKNQVLGHHDAEILLSSLWLVVLFVHLARRFKYGKEN